MAMRLEAVRVGRVIPLGPEQVPSGYVKQTRVEPITVSALGLMGDEQADLSVHGGPDKAVYGYAASHYATWRSEILEHANLLVPGGMGENLTIAGVDEADLCIGDVHRIGTVTVQVCQPRQPCFKLATYFGDAKMPRAFCEVVVPAGTTASSRRVRSVGATTYIYSIVRRRFRSPASLRS